MAMVERGSVRRGCSLYSFRHALDTLSGRGASGEKRKERACRIDDQAGVFARCLFCLFNQPDLSLLRSVPMLVQVYST